MGDRAAKDVLTEAREMGISEKTLRRAADDIGIESDGILNRSPFDVLDGIWRFRKPQVKGSAPLTGSTFLTTI